MSLDDHAIVRVGSPSHSGRSSPNPRSRLKDDDLFRKDKGLRRYAGNVERVLAQFNAVDEWADYISFLSRLLKTLQGKPSSCKEIAHKQLVAKRLSQCLNPVLPSGVHQKTIEVYAWIFSAIGKQGLSMDLSLYLPGLAPILSFASLSVKPNILSLFETHVVKLDSVALRPALRALILSLLPSLEEENGEEFERTLRIIEALKSSIAGDTNTDLTSHQYFWQCFFLASITSSSRRSGALAYLTRYLPVLGTSKNLEAEDDAKLRDAILTVASPEPGLLIRCFCTGLQDNQLLLQRGFLDLLVTRLPIHSHVLQRKAVPADVRELITAASSVVFRRDMSLNRRLWSWFLGPEQAAENSLALSPTSPRASEQTSPRQEATTTQMHYFEKYGLTFLVSTIKQMIGKESRKASERCRPLRIGLSLMDRWEIGSVVTPQIFIPALQSIWHYCQLGITKEAQSEAMKSAYMFFDAVESSIIWSEIAKLIAQALTYESNTQARSCEILDFVLFLLNNFNIREEEMQVVHMPLVSTLALIRLRTLIEETVPDIYNRILVTTLQIISKLVELIPTRALKNHGSYQPLVPISFSVPEKNDVVLKIEAFYSQEHGNIDAMRPVPEEKIGTLLLCVCFDIIAPQLRTQNAMTIHPVETTTSILNNIIRKGPHTMPDMEEFFSTFVSDSNNLGLNSENGKTFVDNTAKVLCLETISNNPHSTQWITTRFLRQCLPNLVADIWPALSPTCLKHNVEAARALWRLQHISHNDCLVESTLSTLMLSRTASESEEVIELESARRFATLWTHSYIVPPGSHSRRPSVVPTKPDTPKYGPVSELSMLERPLMLVLDTLELPKNPSSIFVSGWLDSLPTMAPIVDNLMSRLTSTPLIVNIMSPAGTESVSFDDDTQDSLTCLFYLRRILRIFDIPSPAVWQAMLNSPSSAIASTSKSLQEVMVTICMQLLNMRGLENEISSTHSFMIKQTALSILMKTLSGPFANSMAELNLDDFLLDKLKLSVHDGQHALQIAIMEVLLSALQMRISDIPAPKPRHERKTSREMNNSTLQIETENIESQNPFRDGDSVHAKLTECLILGISSPNCRSALENWIHFLGGCLPLYRGAIFSILIPLVECFCTALGEVLKDVQSLFSSIGDDKLILAEPTTALLLNGLEQTLATAHECLENEEAGATPIKTPEQPQTGFFGNMVSGVFTSETTQSRSRTANQRLTVLLCFKDAIRISFKLWLWGDSGRESSLRDMSAAASFNYITLRLRNRTRRLFEHLFAVEPLECLETLIDLWHTLHAKDGIKKNAVLNLLNALENSRPKNTIPAIFDAIYSRTNPNALDPSRKSTLTSELSDVILSAFLVAYAKSLEDDAMDEIWTDCSTFLKDVLANPMPHRQTLYRLLEFAAILGGKVDKTNFGEQRKMRRDLGDLFNKLLAATLTIRPIGTSLDSTSVQGVEKSSNSNNSVSSRLSPDDFGSIGSDDLISVLANVASDLPKILVEPDRIAYTAGTISTQILLPLFRSKSFPSNVHHRTLELVKALTGITEASKNPKKDITEAFNDPRFFSTDIALLQDGWLPILRSWVLADKERLPELVLRLTPPAAAGFLGVGVASARLDADRRTQLNLRRIAILLLSAPKDTFVAHLAIIQEKINDLLTATSTSSPSTATRSEVYMLLRAILLRTSVIHLSSFWPTINTELYESLSLVYPNAESNESLNLLCMLQACKLLDTLLVLGLDDFQMQEWLFISDTTDVIYRPHELESVALVDKLAESLDAETEGREVTGSNLPVHDQGDGIRRPMLMHAITNDVPLHQIKEKLIKPFLRQLSIHTFESTYGMLDPDIEACENDLMRDIFDDGTIVQ